MLLSWGQKRHFVHCLSVRHTASFRPDQVLSPECSPIILTVGSVSGKKKKTDCEISFLFKPFTLNR